ncbi:MAG TPA: DNA-binding domain-containing protein [Steroidobacteraceae bacterium]|nr:DNA-binding domain-containing protein [Steroidobacteraceae bacterium]
MTLAELERAVQRHILGGGPLPESLAAAVAPPAAERWSVYVEAYRLRLTEALAAQYPALAARAGGSAFAALAGAFIAETPSVHRSIRDYGRELAAHLAAGARGAEDEMRAELAAFEWRLAAAFDAAPGRPTAPAELAAVAPEAWPGLCFRAVPALGRLATETNAVAVWRAAKAAGDAAPEPLADPVAARPGRVEWLILRPALDAEFRSLPPDEAAALDRLLAGEPFGALCEALAGPRGEAGAAATAAGWLKGWLLAGALERV